MNINGRAAICIRSAIDSMRVQLKGWLLPRVKRWTEMGLGDVRRQCNLGVGLWLCLYEFATARLTWQTDLDLSISVWGGGNEVLADGRWLHGDPLNVDIVCCQRFGIASAKGS